MGIIAESESAGSGKPESPLLADISGKGHKPEAGDGVLCALASLQGALLRQYLRLEQAERSLVSGAAARAARGMRHKPAGIGAQRQLELERQRLGRELHTGVGQLLTAMRLQLEAISQQLPEPPEAVRHSLEHLSLLLGEATEQVRGVSKRLHPPEWQRLTIEEAIRQLWELSGIPQSTQASLRIEPLPKQPDLPIKILVYRTAQEALSNLTRHARATRVDAALESRDGRVYFEIRDNGVGYDVAALRTAPASLASGIGLRSMQELAASLESTLEVESGTVGTTLILSAPLYLE